MGVAVVVMILMLTVVLTAFGLLRIVQKADGVEHNNSAVQAIGIANGIFIAIMNLLYQKLAHRFTLWENHRTQVLLHCIVTTLLIVTLIRQNTMMPMCLKCLPFKLSTAGGRCF